MKKFLSILLVLMMVVGLFGIATAAAPADKTYTIGMSQCNLGEPWRVAMNAQIAAEAKNYPMFNVVYADAAQDNSKQIADIQNFIQMGVDLLICSPNEDVPLTDVVKQAYDSGIPVILLDRKIVGDSYTQFIGADNKLIGQECGKYVAETLLPNGGNICEIKGLEGTSAGADRDEGFRAGIAENPKCVIIAAQNADWLREKAITVAQDMLQTNDQIDLFFGLNDPMAEGAYIAAQNLGREKDIMFVGVDGLPTPDGGIQSVIDGRLNLTMIYPTGGKEAVDNAYALLVEGQALDKNVTLGTQAVTPDNAAELLKQFNG